MNWWHWITAISDEVHVVQIFSSPKRQIIEGSDMLRKTPPKVFQQAYDINAKQFASTLSPITKTVVIGPPDCVSLTSTSESTHPDIPLRLKAGVHTVGELEGSTQIWWQAVLMLLKHG